MRIEFTVPSGSPQGTIFTFPGMTNCVTPNTIAGSIIFKINYINHSTYRIAKRSDGKPTIDLETDITINMCEALLGFKKNIKFLDGTTLTIMNTNITKPGIYTIPNFGMINPDASFGGKKGHLHINVKIDFPTKLADDIEGSNTKDVLCHILGMEINNDGENGIKLQNYSSSHYNIDSFLYHNVTTETKKTNDYILKETYKKRHVHQHQPEQSNCQQS